MKRMLNVLIVDGGGRGHALAWKVFQSPRVGKLYVAPGNGGTKSIATNVPIQVTEINALLAFAIKEGIDLTIVGQDDALMHGIVNAFQKKGLAIWGPTTEAAQIEGWKVFSKKLMKACDVPTAPFEVYRVHAAALQAVQHHFEDFDRPLVIKASGLALGKGVYVCKRFDQAKVALDEIMLKRVHGHAGDEVLLESFVEGPEVSIHAFTDGNSSVLFPASRDFKAAFNGGEGPNTGGLGAIAPVPGFTQYNEVQTEVVDPILAGLRKRGWPFVGLLYPGLKVSPEGLMVLEYNARPGDPETQVYMRLLKTDLIDIVEASLEGRLHEIEVEWNPGFAMCVVMASGGYPSPNYKKGFQITGIEAANMLPGVMVFHAGTKYMEEKFLTWGGRVVSVTCVRETLEETRRVTYEAVSRINFTDAHYRTDIGDPSLM